MGGQWFNIGKKSETRTNYVEISEEQQATIDKANKAARDAKIAEGLSNKQADLDKGVRLQNEQGVKNNAQHQNPAVKSSSNKTLAVVGGLGLATVAGVIGFCVGGPFGAAAGVGLVGVMVGATSCSEDYHNPPEIPHAGVSLTLNNKELTDWIVGKLNDTEYCKEQGIKKETEDGIGYEFGYDTIQGSDNVKPYIMVGDGIKLYIDPTTPPTDKNVVDYINQIGDDLKTTDGIGYHFNLVDGKPQVELDNGFTHMYGENTEVKDDSPLGALYGMFGKVGLDNRENKTKELITNIVPNHAVGIPDGEYGNADKGIKFELVPKEPSDLREITEGNPHVKGSIYGFEFDGKVEKLATGEVVIKGDDGKEQLRFTTVDKTVIEDELNGVVPDEVKNSDKPYEGVLVKTADGTEVLMQNIGTKGFAIGEVGRDGMMSITHAFPIKSEKFNTGNALEGDRYFDEKRGNLTDTQNEADETFRKYKVIGVNVEADVEVIIDTPPYRD